MDWDRHFEGLNAIGYSGYVTVHESNMPYASAQEAAMKCYEFLKPYTSHVSRS